MPGDRLPDTGPHDELIREIDVATDVMNEADPPHVDESKPFDSKPTTALRQPEWGDYVWRLERALRAQTAETERLRAAQPQWREMVQAQQAELDALGRRLTEARADLAEARAAAPPTRTCVHRAEVRLAAQDALAAVGEPFSTAQVNRVANSVMLLLHERHAAPGVTREQVRDALMSKVAPSARPKVLHVADAEGAVMALLRGEGT